MAGNMKWWILMLALVSVACSTRTTEVPDRTERIEALRRSLLIHDMYQDMSMSLSMSMEHGKGKEGKSKSSSSKSKPSKSKSSKGKCVSSETGKGTSQGKGITPETGKGTGKGVTPETGKGTGKGKGVTPESGKGIGKGKGSSPVSKKGKGKGKGESPTPEVAPSPSMPVAPTESVAPTEPVAPSETSAPSPSTSIPRPPTPPTAGDIGIVLTPYNILYTIEQTRIPNEADYRGVAEMTQAYLDGFFAGVLELSTDIMFSSSSTVNSDRTFRLGQPVKVEYNTSIFLSSLSSVVPGEEELNALLMSAFAQQNAEYLEAVQGLSRVNIFSTATSAEFVESTPSDDIDEDVSNEDSQSSEGSSTSSQPVGLISAAAAGAMLLLATGYVVYRRSVSEDEPEGKFFDQDGHVTIAGETYTGETYAGASCVDSQSCAENTTHGYLHHSWDPNSEYMQDDVFHRPSSPDAIFEDIPVDDCSEGTCESYDYAKP